MVVFKVTLFVLFCLVGVALAVFARKLVAWQIRSSRNLEPDRRQYVQGFLSYNSRVILVEIWLIRIAGTVAALLFAFLLALVIGNSLGS